MLGGKDRYKTCSIEQSQIEYRTPDMSLLLVACALPTTFPFLECTIHNDAAAAQLPAEKVKGLDRLDSKSLSSAGQEIADKELHTPGFSCD
jgi:hypothetical protein